jgi:hypothetical protein
MSQLQNTKDVPPTSGSVSAPALPALSPNGSHATPQEECDVELGDPELGDVQQTSETSVHAPISSEGETVSLQTRVGANEGEGSGHTVSLRTTPEKVRIL